MVPASPKIYHIVHLDRLPSVIADGRLLCDAIMARRKGTGTTIGMNAIKERRLVLPITSRPGLKVGDCVPFYWCPRSVMLFLIHCGNHPNLTYRGGQQSIVHLEADFHATVEWAEAHGKRWAFTLSNAGASYFEDRCALEQLSEVDWESIRATRWAGSGVSATVKEGKQAEFLVEECFPWELVRRIGVYWDVIARRVDHALGQAAHRPMIEVRKDWYY